MFALVQCVVCKRLPRADHSLPAGWWSGRNEWPLLSAPATDPYPRYATSPGTCAHINPAVTLTAAAVGQLPWREAASYLPAQVAGGIAGTLLANLMFGLPPAEISTTVRDAPITWLGDLVATVGLLSLIFTLVATRSFNFLPAAVGAYVAGAYYFTSSTGIANPAVAIGRIFTDTFAGIAPQSAAIVIHTHPTAATLVTLGWRLLAATNRSP